jgi:hypothetical protein
MVGCIEFRVSALRVEFKGAVLFTVPEGAFYALRVLFAVIAPYNGLLLREKVGSCAHLVPAPSAVFSQ